MSRYTESDRYQGNKKIHQGKKLAKKSRIKPVRKSDNARRLALAKQAAKKLVTGTMQRNKKVKKK